jgi:hypothetical protein
VSARSTAEILALRVLGASVDQLFVDWAVAQLEAGRDSPHLRVLAGEIAPFNYFEMSQLLDKVLQELGLELPPDDETALRNYARERVLAAIAGSVSASTVLSELAHLCIEFGYPRFLYDFYLLHWAKSDLQEQEVQWYWPDADRENIDSVISSHFETWLKGNGTDA